MIVPIILAGGSGSRLWPLSREAYPKQFIALTQGQSLFQHTLARVGKIKGAMNPIVMGNEQHRFLMAEQIRQSSCPESTIIVEPCFRGTAPAVALAAMEALEAREQDAILLVLPADHMIENVGGFAQTIEEGLPSALQGKLVTFGVVPTRPETGYGYIQKGLPLRHANGFSITRFVEKPNASTAKAYIESQEYWWNSGMFLFSAASFLQELMLLAPEIYTTAKNALEQAKRGDDFIRPQQEDFEQCPLDSIDYAVMEKTHNGVVVPLHSEWNDVGAWDALVDLYPKDENQNVCRGDVITKNAKHCFIQSEHRLVAVVGVENVIVVETSDAVLVLNKSDAQLIKPIVSDLKAQSRKEVIFHRRVNRPWGAFESIDNGDRFQVKHITVAVGGRLSLQRHQHRSEHWVVVQGTARVTRGEDVFLLTENQSTYIPIGVNHRLENVGSIPLDIIEVQSGDYLGEDDIQRLEDHYGRSQEVGVSLNALSESIELRG